MFDRLQRGDFLAVHQGESITDILGAARPADPMDVIFRMLGHIVIDHVAHAGDVESARGDVGRDHHFIFAALETFQRFDAFALGAVRMQHRDGMVALFQFVRDAVGAVLGATKRSARCRSWSARATP